MLSATFTAGGSMSTGSGGSYQTPPTSYGTPTRVVDTALATRPAVRPPTMAQGATAAQNTGIVPTAAPEKPWYKKWQTWAIVGGVVVGVTGVVIIAR